jgi:hypothetical protein
MRRLPGLELDRGRDAYADCLEYPTRSAGPLEKGPESDLDERQDLLAQHPDCVDLDLVLVQDNSGDVHDRHAAVTGTEVVGEHHVVGVEPDVPGWAPA